MSLVSNTFLLFAAAAVILYYLCPGKARWIVLLLFSYLYYASGGVRYLFFILYSTLVTYGFALWIARGKETGASEKKLKGLAAAGLLLNLGMLGVVKYAAFFAENLNALTGWGLPVLQILFPLGISFYTFQSSGYLLDVYWDRAEAEKNLFRYALFVSFFPQLMQGPIGNFGRLSPQLLGERPFRADDIGQGCARMIRGFAKKMLIADWAGLFADAIWADPQRFGGACLAGAVLYGIQLYADFSGAMDVVIGIARLFGIELDENFKRPYLAVSLTDFWKRWHITLGQWMKNYVFYPLTLSEGMKRFSRWARKHCGKKIGRALPIAAADLVVFLLVGIWHGPAWTFIVYGLYNGLIIAFSELMAGPYRSMKARLRVSGKEGWYRVFMIVRTYLIVTFSFFFDRSPSLGQAFLMIRQALTRFDLTSLLQVEAGREGAAYVPMALLTIGAGCLVMVVIGILEERGLDVGGRLRAAPRPAAFAVYLAVLVLIGMLGLSGVPRGFIYAQF